MLDRLTVPAVATPDAATTLMRRRVLFAAICGVTIVALLALAAIALPPTTPLTALILILFAITLPWSVLGFWNATIGLLLMQFSRDPVLAVNPLVASVRGDEPITASTAIAMCIRNESPDQIVRNLEPLMRGLVQAGVAPLFHIYLLSDSSDPDVIAAEESRFRAFTEVWNGVIPVTYRRRAVNTGFKAGNMLDFCDRWGANHDYAISLDADSFMPADAVLRLLRIMQANPQLGILQTLIVGMPTISAFPRLFQFGMRLGMRSYTLGGAWWQGDCGPYWGHNAAIRLKPFSEHCRIPELQTKGPLGGHVLAHDQVDAALMRRAGYDVRVLPEEQLSFEDNPPTLLEFIRRDLRWCHGNMQYWQLLGLPGLKPVSRFQLVFAILMYLGSPAWMALVAIGTIAVALSERQEVIVRSGAGLTLFAIIMLMVFAPKIASIIDVLSRRSSRYSFGGSAQFLTSVVCETLFSLLLAPIMSLIHTLFLFRLFVLRRGLTWNSQLRESHAVPWRLATEKLWAQTLAGITVISAFAMKRPGDLGLAVMGAGGLALSIPFAVATASPRIGRLLMRIGLCRIPEEVVPPESLLSLRLPALEGVEAHKPISRHA